MGDSALSHQVVHVIRPVLDGGVANACILLHHNLNDRRVQRVRLVDGGGTALNVMHIGPLIRDNEGALKLAHVLSINTEIRLQRDFHVHPRGDVHKRPAGPHGGVQSRELIIADGDDRAEVLFEKLRVVPQTGVGIDEDHALRFQIFTDLVVHNLRLVLCGHTSDQRVTFRLGNAQTLIGNADILGKLLPRLRLPFS